MLTVVISVAEEMWEPHHGTASVQNNAYENDKGFYLREIAVKFI